MREAILKTYPDHGIIGEEFDEHEGSSEFKWVLGQLMEPKVLSVGL
ncbi:MAG: hypothetical protein MZV64_03195 [Ignavibacteriales bacterium]|nr:hypothetical protein [Ignavibacteriales bacterium]